MLIKRELYYRWAPWPRCPEVDALFDGREGLTPLEICDAGVLPVHSRLCALLRPEVLPQLDLDELACAFARRALRLDPYEPLCRAVSLAEARCATQRSAIALRAQPGNEARRARALSTAQVLVARLRSARNDALNRSVDTRLSDVQRAVARAVRYAVTIDDDDGGPFNPLPASAAAGSAATAYYLSAPDHDASATAAQRAVGYQAELAYYWDLLRRRLVALPTNLNGD